MKAGCSADGGFTLMEVCVALAVLVAGAVVFGRYLDGFNRVRALERQYANAVLADVQFMESFILTPPPCLDSSFTINGVNVTLKVVPGVKPLAWAQVGTLRRLVRCVR
jgi:prepilin-type N-terminal cleavage/methylation domain-containing protein